MTLSEVRAKRYEALVVHSDYEKVSLLETIEDVLRAANSEDTSSLTFDVAEVLEELEQAKNEIRALEETLAKYEENADAL